jgi:hypothetical protein
MNISDERIRQIENEQAALPGATRDNLTVRTVHAVLASLTADADTGGPRPALTDAARDVLAERRRQVSDKGMTPAHDDRHDEGELATAAGCYAIWGWGGLAFTKPGDEPKPWPWNRKWWKPSTLRRQCVKAAALLLAEIERIDRHAARQSARAK